MATGARERRLWWGFAAYVAALYASAYGIQFVLLALRDAGALRVSVALAFLAFASMLGAWLLRQGPGRWEVASLVVIAAVYAVALTRLEIVQERLHLLQYGVAAAIAEAAFRERWRQRPRGALAAGLAAFLVTAAAGWGDEIVQHFLPNRTYDLRDVRLNALSGALLLAAAALRRRAREADGVRRRGGPAARRSVE